MAAVSREFLATLKALAHDPYDRAATEATLLARLQAGLPGWTAAPADNLRRALPIEAESMFLHGEMENNNFHMGQMVNAEGLYLDVFGVERNLPRLTGEDDDDYLFRLANSGQSQGLGSPPFVEGLAVAFNPLIVDVQVTTRANRQDMNVYAVKASHTALSTQEAADLLAHLNLRDKKMGGVDVYVPAVTQTAFTIDVTVRHGPSIGGDTIAMEARDALYQWLADHQKIGDGVYQSAISRAAFVEDAEDATVAAPAADLGAVDGTVYTCGANATEVIVRTVAI